MSRTTLPMNIIAAVDTNFGIGKENKLPWHLPKEYSHFIRLTTLTNEPGKMNAVIMGRKCWESIPEKFRPLKNRLNIVLSRSMEPKITEQLIVTNNMEHAMEILSTEMFRNKIETIWNVGGHDIYKIGLRHPHLYKLVLTRLDKDFDCDVKFPDIEWEHFEPDDDFKDALPVEEKGIKWHITSYIMKMFPFNTPYNYLLNWSFVCFAIPWLYSYFNEQHRLSSMPVEQAMLKAWETVINQPSIKFRKVMVGINCNVDVIVSGVNVINKLNISSPNPIGDKEMLNGFEDLYEAFVHFFSRGAPAERFMANEEAFDKIVATIEDKHLRAQHYIGGNAALMAQKIAGSFPHATAYLIGPIGPRSQALLHPAIVPNNSTRIIQDEMHVILEYKQGEILGEYVSPASSRFIISHDQFSGSAMVIEMFFKAIMQLRPDLILLSGIHVLEVQNQDVRLEKLRLIKRSLLQVNPLIPIHLQLGSMADASIADDILKRIIPNVDSLGINEQELTFLSKVGGGPFNERYPISAGTLHAYKAVEMLYWLLSTYGHDRSNPESKSYNQRLQRIHFFSLTYHIMVSKGPDWSNLAAGLAAGARLAGRQSCSLNMAASDRADFDKLEIRSSQTVLLDKQINKVYQFNPHSPLASWMRGDLVFLYTPVLVCKYPQHTVGVDDAISSTALLYSQFYKLEKKTW